MDDCTFSFTSFLSKTEPDGWGDEDDLNWEDNAW